MNFQRIIIGLLVLLVAGLAGSFYMNWKTWRSCAPSKPLSKARSLPMRSRPAKGAEHNAVQMEWRQADRRDRLEFGQAEQGHDHRQLHAGRRQRLLRLRSDQEEGRYRIEFPRTGIGSVDTWLVSSQMASEQATRIIDLYQRKALDWIESRARASLFEKPWLDRFRALLPTAAPILDIGCGSAEPMAGYLIELGYPVVGVDSSPAMIEVCRRQFPKQEWIVADMRKLALRRKFSGILAWDSFFHLCHGDQRQMFPVFREHAAPKAALMFTSGPAHGEAIGSSEASHCITRASIPPNIVHCSIGTGFVWCRMSLRTRTAAAIPSGSRSSISGGFAPGLVPPDRCLGLADQSYSAGRRQRFAIMIRSRKRPISDRISWNGT